MSLLVAGMHLHDARLMVNILEALEELLKLDEFYGWKKTDDAVARNFELNDGLDALEEVQKHPNKKVYDLSSHILTTYFEVDGEMEGTETHNRNNNQVGFNI